jgi:AcrR family transcriptional regulator
MARAHLPRPAEGQPHVSLARTELPPRRSSKATKPAEAETVVARPRKRVSAAAKAKAKVAARAPARTPRKRGTRRAEIVEAAKALFAAKGFEPTSIREIGDAAGILSGSLYHHFKTKEEILDEIIREYALGLLHAYQQALTVETDSQSALEALIRTAIQEISRKREEHAILMQEFKYLSRHENFGYLRDIRQQIYKLWDSVLQDGVRTGKFRQDINLHLTQRIIINAINSTVTWYRPNGRYKLGEMVDTQISLLLHGLSAS